MSKIIEQVQLKRQDGTEIMPKNTVYDVFMDYGSTAESLSTKISTLENNKVDKIPGKGLSANDYSSAEKAKLSGIAVGAEVNQNAFSTIIAGATTIAADSKTDSLTIAAGGGISITGDTTNDKVTITNSGVRSITTGTSVGTISVNTNGTATDITVKGLGSAAYTATTAYDAAGTAQTKANEALASAKTYADSAAATVKDELLNGAGPAYDTLKKLGDLMDENTGAIDALETIAASKQPTITGAATTITSNNLTASRALISNSSGKIAISDVTSTELSYLDGVTSAIQTQLNGKAPTNHAVNADTYGLGTNSVYGHVKLSDAVNSSNGVTTGQAASSKAVKSAYDLASGANTQASNSIISLSFDATTRALTGTKNSGGTAGIIFPVPSSIDFGLVKDGGDVTIIDGVITVNDNSHNHIMSNIEGLGTSLASKVSKAGDTMSGDLVIEGSAGLTVKNGKINNVAENPYLGLKDTGYTTQWYVQAYLDTLAFGPTYANAVKVTKTGSMTVPESVTASGGFIGNATTSSYPLGFGANGGDITWGALAGDTTTTTGYRTIARWDSPNGGSVAFADGPMSNPTKAGQTSMQIDGYFYQEEGAYQVIDNRYMENRIDGTGYVHMKTRLVVAGNGSSYNEGIRVLPASNGWSNAYFSDNNALSGTNTNGWLLGRRGAPGSNTTAAAGDFTIECNNSDGRGLTLKPSGDAYIYGNNFSLGNTKVILQYDSTNECLNFIFN